MGDGVRRIDRDADVSSARAGRSAPGLALGRGGCNQRFGYGAATDRIVVRQDGSAEIDGLTLVNDVNVQFDLHIDEGIYTINITTWNARYSKTGFVSPFIQFLREHKNEVIAAKTTKPGKPCRCRAGLWHWPRTRCLLRENDSRSVGRPSYCPTD